MPKTKCEFSASAAAKKVRTSTLTRIMVMHEQRPSNNHAYLVGPRAVVILAGYEAGRTERPF